MQSVESLYPGCIKITQKGRSQIFYPDDPNSVCDFVSASANFTLEYVLYNPEIVASTISIPQFAQHTLLCTMKQTITQYFGIEISSDAPSTQWFESIQLAKREKTLSVQNSKLALNLRFPGACKSSTLIVREIANGKVMKLQFSIPSKNQDGSKKRKHSETLEQTPNQTPDIPEKSPGESIIGRTIRPELRPGDLVKFYRLDDTSQDIFRINSVGKPNIEDASEVWLLNTQTMEVIIGTIRNRYEVNETIRVGDLIEITLPNGKAMSGKFELSNIKTPTASTNAFEFLSAPLTSIKESFLPFNFLSDESFL